MEILVTGPEVVHGQLLNSGDGVGGNFCWDPQGNICSYALYVYIRHNSILDRQTFEPQIALS